MDPWGLSRRTASLKERSVNRQLKYLHAYTDKEYVTPQDKADSARELRNNMRGPKKEKFDLDALLTSELGKVKSLMSGKPPVSLPQALSGGPADTHVYYGTKGGKRVYVGITNDLKRRQMEHGARFTLEPITKTPLTRGEARAIEQVLIKNNPGFENIRNSISPTHTWYNQAVEWGEQWLRNN